MRIIGVGLIDLHAQGGLCVARVDADDRHPACAQGPGQEVRQQSGLKPGPDKARSMLTDCSGNGIGVGGALATPHHCALLINHTD
jgi:hypothetical protein